ncbi:hypothetical protein L2E82_35959 [Cichorium intybus]|uniref:Uncharacterized protein n=1 Tax=Cichorium intybus TaxID=13427 RepID=A0ACB9BQ80_CICIN|nr:hypothetical protein L2E82_35959 [Cichorium intybus]
MLTDPPPRLTLAVRHRVHHRHHQSRQPPCSSTQQSPCAANRRAPLRSPPSPFSVLAHSFLALLSRNSNAPPSLTNHQRVIASQIRMKLAGFLNMYYKNHTFSRNQKHPSSWINVSIWSKMSTGVPIEIYSGMKTIQRSSFYSGCGPQSDYILLDWISMNFFVSVSYFFDLNLV